MASSKTPQVLDSTKIIPVVELTLTKADLVDMVVAEQEEVIETQLELIETQIKKIEKDQNTASQDHDKALTKLLKETHGKRIKAAKRFFGPGSTDRCDYRQEVYPRYKENSVWNADCRYYKYIKYDSRRRRMVDSVMLPNFRASYDIVYVIQIDGDECGRWSVDLDSNMNDDNMPSFKKLLELNKEHRRLVIARCDALSTQSNIETMGRRTKAAMVRQFLNGSKQGRQLLETVPKMDYAKLLTSSTA